jgi:hypothetical protein
VAEAFTQRACDRLPLCDVVDEYAGAHHLLQRTAERHQRTLDLVEHEVCLCGGIAAADRQRAMGGGGAAHHDAIAKAGGAAVAGKWLPDRAAQAVGARLVHFRHSVGRRKRLHVMTEVARCRKKWRLAVFVATVARDRRESRQHVAQQFAIFVVEAQR